VNVAAHSIDASKHTIAAANGTTGNPTAGNVPVNNGNGTDTFNGNPVTIDLVTLTITTPQQRLSMVEITIDPTTGTRW
jgi:hypothetical protein